MNFFIILILIFAFVTITYQLIKNKKKIKNFFLSLNLTDFLLLFLILTGLIFFVFIFERINIKILAKEEFDQFLPNQLKHRITFIKTDLKFENVPIEILEKEINNLKKFSYLTDAEFEIICLENCFFEEELNFTLNLSQLLERILIDKQTQKSLKEDYIKLKEIAIDYNEDLSVRLPETLLKCYLHDIEEYHLIFLDFDFNEKVGYGILYRECCAIDEFITFQIEHYKILNEIEKKILKEDKLSKEMYDFFKPYLEKKEDETKN